MKFSAVISASEHLCWARINSKKRCRVPVPNVSGRQFCPEHDRESRPEPNQLEALESLIQPGSDLGPVIGGKTVGEHLTDLRELDSDEREHLLSTTEDRVLLTAASVGFDLVTRTGIRRGYEYYSDEDVSALAVNPHVSHKVLRIIAGSGEEKYATAVAANPSIDRQMVRMLINTTPTTAAALVKNPAVVGENAVVERSWLLNLLRQSSWMAVGTCRVELDDDIRDAAIHKSGDFANWHLIVRDHKAHPSNLGYLARCRFGIKEGRDLDHALACNPNLDAETIRLIVKRRLRLLASNKKGGKVFRVNSQILALLARHRNAPTDVVETLSCNEVGTIRAGAAANLLLSPQRLADLAGDAVVEVRCCVAQHPCTEPGVLRSLADDSEIVVLRALAEHMNSPPDVLERISCHKDYTLQNKLSFNENTPPEAIKNVVDYGVNESGDSRIQFRCARHPNITAESLVMLSKDVSMDVAARAAAHPAMPLERLIELSQSNLYAVRAGAASNPQMPEDVLVLMMADVHDMVRVNATVSMQRKGT